MPIETFRPDANLMVSDLDMKNQILLEDEFWDIVGGKGTFTELLEIYREVGEEKGRQIIKRLGYGF
jgi:type II restriction endonuclease TdeIII